MDIGVDGPPAAVVLPCPTCYIYRCFFVRDTLYSLTASMGQASFQEYPGPLIGEHAPSRRINRIFEGSAFFLALRASLISPCLLTKNKISVCLSDLLPVLQREIDQAEDREKALAFHRTNTQFGDFMDKLLLEIAEYRRGGPDEPELVATDP